MYRVQLSEEQQQELSSRSRRKGLVARTRDRLEMIRLSGAGVSIPRIATHLRVSEKRVRHWIKAFLSGGFEALPDGARTGRPAHLTPLILQAVREEIGKGDRTWTAGQLATWISEQQGVQVSADYLGRRLRQEGLAYKRTSRSLKHKQKPEEVEAKREELEDLEKRGTRA